MSEWKNWFDVPDEYTTMIVSSLNISAQDAMDFALESAMRGDDLMAQRCIKHYAAIGLALKKLGLLYDTRTEAEAAEFIMELLNEAEE